MLQSQHLYSAKKICVEKTTVICCKEKQYMLINFSYASIHFKLDLKETYSEGLLMYKKCCLYAFQNTISKLLDYKPQCFLLGKEYYYKKTLLPKKEFIGYVLIDEKLKFKFRLIYRVT